MFWSTLPSVLPPVPDAKPYGYSEERGPALGNCCGEIATIGIPSGADDLYEQLSLDKTAVCPMVYEPVVGIDGKTYGNRCEAARKGVAARPVRGLADALLDAGGIVSGDTISPQCCQTGSKTAGCTKTYRSFAAKHMEGAFNCLDGECQGEEGCWKWSPEDGSIAVETGVPHIAVGDKSFWPVIGLAALAFGYAVLR